MKARVLLLSTIHPATDPRICYKIAPALASSGYQVFCVLPHANQQKHTEFQTISLPLFKNLLFRLLLSHPVLLWKCLRLKPQLVHIFVPELIPVALLFQFLGAKVIYEVQENMYKKFAIKTYNNASLFQFCFEYFDQVARQKFHCVFTEAAYLTTYHNLAHSFTVIQNFVSMPLMDQITTAENKSSDQLRLFYAGVISLERSFDIMLAAFVKLKEKHPDFHVDLFGPVRCDVHALPGFDSVSGNMTFHGYVDQKLVLPFARGCVAGIALLKPVADYPESYTTKLFEYMALCLPVITSDFPLYKKVVEHSECGFCISPYDAGELFEKIVWLTENRDEGRKMGINGRNAVEKYYNWAQEEIKLLSFYTHLLKSEKDLI